MGRLTTGQFERGDRHVRRSYLRLQERTSLHRISFSLEEALRLAWLPGEDEGRVYYFRRVSLSHLPSDGERKSWQEKVQRTLNHVATAAVHGADRRAASAEAVFFFSYQEALEHLLHRLVHRATDDAWFWPLIDGTSASESRRARVADVIERIRLLPASDVAVAQAVFQGPVPLNVLELLSAIPVDKCLSWLRQLGDAEVIAPAVSGLPAATIESLQHASQRFGRSDPRTLWLASLAVLSAYPVSRNNGTTIPRANAILSQLSAPPQELPGSGDPSKSDNLNLPRAIEFEDQNGAKREDRNFDRRLSGVDGMTDALIDELPPLHADMAVAKMNAHNDGAHTDGFILGQHTANAGLYFLLNALSGLGIALAVKSTPAFVEYGLVVRIIEQLARHAGVNPEDPILGWARAERSTDVATAGGRDVSFDVRSNPKIWPPNLAPSRRHYFDTEDMVRVWSLAVRRWCWRTAGIAVRDIVNRHGSVSLNRTDLDVFFALNAADLRIRRAGLDIDPGWLSWFGRAVRFHYTQSDTENAVC
jgi:hypothetical protein